MVRHRPRTIDRATKWDQKSLEAVTNDERKLTEVTRYFNIPLSTLQDRLKSGVFSQAQLGRKSTFTKEQEQEISNHLLLLAKPFMAFHQLNSTD